jgi:type I restriction enzyme R subunit
MNDLDDEEKRYVREGFNNDEELDHWTEKEETQAAVDILIRDTLWSELPDSYDDRLLNEYRRKIYEFVYTTYPAA